MRARAIVVVSLTLLHAACNPRVTAAPEPARSSEAPAHVPQATASPPAAAAAADMSASASAPSKPVTRAEASAMLAEAERCLADTDCDAAKADALYRRADDAGAADVSCFRFYYGTGVATDLARARGCFARHVVAETPCAGSSPGLDRAYLAAMLIDAQGGSAEPARAAMLFADCYADATVTGLAGEATTRSTLAPDRKPLDFCEDVGGTTITIGECHGVERERVADRRMRVDRMLFPRLDAEGRRRAAKARAAWSAFANEEGEAYSDRYRGGTLRSNAWAGHENALETQRAEAIAHLFDHQLTPGADPAQAERDMEKAYYEAGDFDAERRKLLAAARRAWTAYRDAEIALYAHVLGPSLGEKEIARDVRTMLTKRYQSTLEDVVKP